jgi:cytidine deaminase
MTNFTDIQKQSLIQAATEVLKNPYPKDTKTVYAAAVLTSKGNIYASAQYFSDTYSLTLHAEQAALAHAAAHGEGEIVAIATTSNEPEGEWSYPCHMCKQLLWESRIRSGVLMQVINFDQNGRIEELNLDEMMQFPWPAHTK